MLDIDVEANKGEWSDLSATMTGEVGPSRRDDMVAILWDKAPTGPNMVIFGGVSAGAMKAYHYNDLWALDLTTWVWVQIEPDYENSVCLPRQDGCLTERFSHAGCLLELGSKDGGSVDSYFVVFGGRTLVNDLGDWEMLSDVWLFNLQNRRWAQISATPIQRWERERGG
jgi:hypothetical protein